MARMHSSGRGSSGSTRPRRPDLSSVDYDDDEVEDLVEKLTKQGLMPSEIGRELRDRYGNPEVQAVTGKTGSEIQDERDMGSDIPEDLYRLMERALAIRDHLQQNENDAAAKRSMRLTESKIRRLADYYRGDEIPEDWSYSLQKARLAVQ